MFDPELFNVIGITALPLAQLAAVADAEPLRTGQSMVILLMLVVDADEKSVAVSYTHLTLPTKA